MNFVGKNPVKFFSSSKKAQRDVSCNEDQKVGRARRKWKNQRKKPAELLLALKESP
jgi:hypothetical protein